MMWKRERKRKKFMMRIKIMWKRERKTYKKVKTVGRENIRHNLIEKTSPDPVSVARNGRERSSLR